MEMLAEQKSNNMIESIVIKENAYFFFMCSERQIKDIVKFCCSNSDTAVLGIDTTFNLCNLWITDSCYRNDRIVNNSTENHPVFLGPLLFHFTKDAATFTRFALEMMAIDPAIALLEKIGTDMDIAILNGIKSAIPKVNLLYCVRHMSQRDEKKLDALLSKVNCSSAERKRAKSDILKDIYGERKGTVSEFGLAEAEDIADFNTKLNSLRERWDSRCPRFYTWFEKNRKQKFEESVIASARVGTNVIGMYYQNDIESIHFIEKINQCFQKKSVVEVI